MPNGGGGLYDFQMSQVLATRTRAALLTKVLVGLALGIALNLAISGVQRWWAYDTLFYTLSDRWIIGSAVLGVVLGWLVAARDDWALTLLTAGLWLTGSIVAVLGGSTFSLGVGLASSPLGFVVGPSLMAVGLIGLVRSLRPATLDGESAQSEISTQA